MHPFGIIYIDYKGGWFCADLGSVIKLEPLAVMEGRAMGLNRFAQYPVQGAGGKFQTKLAVDLVESRKNLFGAHAGQGGNL